MSVESAAAAGRLVVTLLFAANAIVYLSHHAALSVAGMALAIIAATLGYFAASWEAYDRDGQGLLLGSILASVASGIAFIVSAAMA